MSKDKISDYSATANSNTDIGGINIDEGCAPSGINDAIRTLMKQLKDWQSGSQDVYIHPAGSASVPSITATGDTNTGLFFPAADTVGITTGGTERARVDSSGNLGLGVTPSAWTSTRAIEFSYGAFGASSGLATFATSNANYNSGWKYTNTSSAGLYNIVGNSHQWFNAASGTAGNAISFTQAMTLDASGRLLLGVTSAAGNAGFQLKGASSGYVRVEGTSSTLFAGDAPQLITGAAATESAIRADGALLFASGGGTERARIDSSGRLLVGATSALVNESSLGVSSAGNTATFKTTGGTGNSAILVWNSGTSGTRGLIQFSAGSSYSAIGSIESNGTSTSYNTSSDYRLKENIQPMTDALSVVSQLKPVTYTWKTDGSNGQGFIAHELQAVVPDCVTGEKDAVDADGNPKYQGIDTSFLVATLTAAIQELKAEFDAYKAAHP